MESNKSNNNKNIIDINESKEENKLLENAIEDEEERLQRQEMINDYKYRKFLNEIPLPTTDEEIKVLLKKLNEPEELFNEKNYERRDRLSNTVFSLIKSYKGNLPDELKKLFGLKKKKQKKKKLEEEFYTEAIPELIDLRKELIIFSLLNSKRRLQKQKEISNNNYTYNINLNFSNNKIQKKENIENTENKEKNFSFYDYTLCQIGDDRGVSMGVLSKDDKIYATSGWSGTCNLFESESLNPIIKLIGHEERINSVSFNKNINNDNKYNLLTTSNDRNIILWNVNKDNNNEYKYNYIAFKGHEDRTKYAEFHPMNNYLFGSCSNDCTFRLWDANKNKSSEILIQEGHKYPVNYFNFHQDGSLVITCDSGGFILLWDLRLGKRIQSFSGHVNSVQKCKFDNNTYQFFSCGNDNMMKVWDIRRGKCLYSLTAHNDMITDFCFDKINEDIYYNKYLFSCSFDKSIKVWNCNNFSLVYQFDIFSNDKITSIDVNKSCNKIYCTSLTKNIKVIENSNIQKK